MSNCTNIKVIRRGGSREIGSNWWQTLILLLAIAAAIYFWRKSDGKSPSGESQQKDAPTSVPAVKQGNDGLFPLSGS